MTCRRRTRQRHNAGCPAFEVRIFYPFHPRAGQMVHVEYRRRFAGEDHLVVTQPDGTLALVPAWMSDEPARAAAITTSPCLSVDRLVELRARLDTLLPSVGGESPLRDGGEYATTTEPTARPVRSRTQSVGHCEHAEDPTCQPDRTPAGRSPGRPRPRDRRVQRDDKGGRS